MGRSNKEEGKIRQEYEKRLKQIYFPDDTIKRDGSFDVRHEEFLALAETFGRGINKEKLQKVEELQVELFQARERLYQQYDKKEVSAEKYVSEVNSMLLNQFTKIKELLGKDDFFNLFGDFSDVKYAQVDLNHFLAQQKHLG